MTTEPTALCAVTTCHHQALTARSNRCPIHDDNAYRTGDKAAVDKVRRSDMDRLRLSTIRNAISTRMNAANSQETLQ